jgi:hypothetical protein
MKRAAVVLVVLVGLVGCSGGFGGSGGDPSVNLRADGAERLHALLNRSVSDADIRPLARKTCGKIARPTAGSAGLGAWLVGAFNLKSQAQTQNAGVLARLLDAYCPDRHAAAARALDTWGIDLPTTSLTP